MPEDNQDEFLIIECLNDKCKCNLRIPKTAKTLRVTCPQCGISFMYPKKNTHKKNSWFQNNIKNHPFFFGLVLTLYLIKMSNSYIMNEWFAEKFVYITGIAFAVWIAGIWILDFFKEKETKWFYQKWFVLLILFLVPPIGITLLWVGSKFTKPFKYIFSIISGLWLVYYLFSPSPRDFISSPQEFLTELLSSQKEEIFLKTSSSQNMEEFKKFILSEDSISESILTGPQIFNEWNDSIVVVIPLDWKGNRLGQGSGIVISPTGAIATNYHVVESAYEVYIRFSNGKTYRKTTLIAENSYYDIVILKIEGNEYFKYVPLGNSDEVEVGEQVLTIGSPLGFENTVSDGVVSGKRDLGDFSLLQITAPVSSGSSGGALFNMKGEIIGITSLGSQWNVQNLNFAIPINVLKKLIRENL